MYTSAVRELGLTPRDIALLPSGELLILSWSAEGQYLEAYDPDLASLWSRPVGKSALGLSVDRYGTPWVLDRAGASSFSTTGEVKSRVEVPTPKDMEVAALAFVDEALVFAYQHAEGAPLHSPVLQRANRDGTVCWSVTLTADAITFEGDPGNFAMRQRRDPFLPTTWVCGYHAAGDLTVSGDTLLALYGDVPRSGLAIGYAVGLPDGRLRYVTKLAPIHNVVARAGGAFLMGNGAFTVLYDRRGVEQTRWASYGRYAIAANDIRVIEMGNTLPRLARLMADGTVVRGDLLEGHYTSPPYVHDNGSLFFAREGILFAARDLLIHERIVIREKGREHILPTRVLAGDEGLFTTYTEHRHTASTSTLGLLESVSGLVRVTI